MTYHVATEKWAWLRGSSPLAMLGMEACCCNNSSFRSHNHESLRFLKLFLLHKDGGKKKVGELCFERSVGCSSALPQHIPWKRPSSVASSIFISCTPAMLFFHKVEWRETGSPKRVSVRARDHPCLGPKFSDIWEVPILICVLYAISTLCKP